MRVSYQVPRTCPRAGGSAFAFFFTWGFQYWHWVLFLQAKYAYSSTDTRICSKFKFMFEESPMRPRYPRVPGCTRLVVPNICSCRVLEKPEFWGGRQCQELNALLNLQLGKKRKKEKTLLSQRRGSLQPATSAMRARALQLSARLEARLSGAHTRPGRGAVPCARRECRCAARGRPRRRKGHLRTLATAWGARAQREHVVCGVAALGPRPPARRSGGAQLPLRAGGHASAATAITSGAGRAPSVAPGASPPQLALGGRAC